MMRKLIRKYVIDVIGELASGIELFNQIATAKQNGDNEQAGIKLITFCQLGPDITSCVGDLFERASQTVEE